MAFFFKKKLSDKEIIEGMINILTKINNGIDLDKTMKDTKQYKENKTLIDRTIREYGAFDSSDKGSIYAKKAISEYLRIYKESDSLQEVQEKLKSSTKIDMKETFSGSMNNPVIKIFELPKNPKTRDDDGWYNYLYGDISNIYDNLLEEKLYDKYRDAVFILDYIHNGAGTTFGIRLKTKSDEPWKK